MRTLQIIIFWLLLGTTLWSQRSITEGAEISILTCSPGAEIYSIFGHSAIRVNDPASEIDWVFNYGTFDFDAPNFTLKFLRGKLLYYLTVTTYDRFLAEYQYTQQDVTEQLVNLSYKDKQAIFLAIQNNLKKENKYYQYDFFFDNCVTRLRDIIADYASEVVYPGETEGDYTFRQLLHLYTDKMPWTQFGMDLILGATTDQKSTVADQMFLPQLFEGYLDKSHIGHDPLIKSSTAVLAFPLTQIKETFLSPTLLFGLLLAFEIVVFFLAYISGDIKKNWWLDKSWFIILTICAVIFTFMWMFTDHKVCEQNWNLLWTVPWMGFVYLVESTGLVRKILISLTILSCCFLLFGQMMIPQEIPLAIKFIIAIGLIKSLRLINIKDLLDRFIRHGAPAAVMVLISLSCVSQDKIGGITMVAPPRAFVTDPMPAIKKVNANWVAFVPYAFIKKGAPTVQFGSFHHWWGERKEGIIESVKLAKAQNLKIMLKPQVWISGSWVGEMEFKSEQDWKTWEETYRNYIMSFVDIAIAEDIEMICIGTEFRIAVEKRASFWRALIKEIRGKYDGLLTYSANWDSYERVPIWEDLDYIGISAYFPLTDFDTPNEMYLSFKWRKTVSKLSKFSEKNNKPILFTEYGYLSVDGAAGKTWELEKKVKKLDINEKAQANALSALYGAFWNKDWWAGGFLWKWFPNGMGHEGYPERDYTPQGKLGAEVISKWYQKAEL